MLSLNLKAQIVTCVILLALTGTAKPIGNLIFVPSLDQSFLLTDLKKSTNFGEIYIAQSTSSHKKLAIKFVKFTGKNFPPINAQEFHPLSHGQNTNPHLVTVYRGTGAILKTNEHVIMDYYEESVAEKLEQLAGYESGTSFYKRRINIAFDLLLQISNALSYLHQKDMVHLDVKPTNILTNGQKYVLADLDGVLRPERLYYSKRYAPLEVELDEHKSRLADLYSLGMTMVSALARYDQSEKINTDPPESVWHLMKSTIQGIGKNKPDKLSFNYISEPIHIKKRQSLAKNLFRQIESQHYQALEPITQKRFITVRDLTLAMVETRPRERREAITHVVNTLGISNSLSRKELPLSTGIHKFLVRSSRQIAMTVGRCQGSVQAK